MRCKYCATDEAAWTCFETGDPGAVNIMVAAADDRGGGTLYIDICYKGVELDNFRLPAVACPFCGRRLRDA